jgi:GT2 family glycosyltransferase
MGEVIPKYQIAAVVVTFNRLALLQECIASLRNQTRQLDEIIVVNNSSTDGTLEWLNDQKDLTIITQPNSGSAGGFHVGIKTAYEKGYDWIWCMDDDAEPELNALEALTKFFNDNNKVLACTVIDEQQIVQLNHRGYFNFRRIKKGDLQYPSELENYSNKESFKADFASFVGIMIHKSIVKDIGLPREDFFICHDDIEYCMRINKISKVLVVANSRIIHKEKIYNKIEIKKRLFWSSQRPLLSSYGVQCLCYRNMFYLYRSYYQNMLGTINVFYNYLVLLRRIILFDNEKYFRWRLLNKSLLQALTNRFDNEYFIKPSFKA